MLVDVYYESMCPDSKYFIKHQLVPAFEKIPEVFDFRLIPYGKAKVILLSHQVVERVCKGNS